MRATVTAPARLCFDWLALLAAVAGAASLRARLQPWVFMWLMTAAVLVGLKWAMWRRGQQWPSEDADGAPGGRALPRMMLGAFLFWGVARWLPGELARGWAGMVGLVLIFHFGVMESVARPIMRQPLRARSVGEFWSRRWNVAFAQMARPLIFLPVRRRLGAGFATAAVFAVSGLLHELVISLPAGGGFGMPTVYFVLQGAVVLMERKWKVESRVVVWLVVAGPVFWLFHPPFVERVIIPMMRDWRAL